MATYTPYRIPLETNLDREGMRLGIGRLPNESSESYALRLRAEVLEPSNGSVASLSNTLTRLVGGNSKAALKISLAYAEGVPVAEAPVVIIEAGRMRFYSAYPNTIVLDIETRTEGETVFISDAIAAINSTAEFTAELIESSLEWEPAKNLRLGNNIKTETLVPFKAQENFDLGRGNILSLRARNSAQLLYEVETPEEVETRGEYCLDSVNGVVTTYEGLVGEVEFDYAEFPFVVFYDQVSAYELFDPTTEFFLQEEAAQEHTTETGYRLLNPLGNKIHRKLLEKAGNQWS